MAERRAPAWKLTAAQIAAVVGFATHVEHRMTQLEAQLAIVIAWQQAHSAPAHYAAPRPRSTPSPYKTIEDTPP